MSSVEIVHDDTQPDVSALTDLWHMLVKLPNANFEWRSWFCIDGSINSTPSIIEKLKGHLRSIWSKQMECGTTACVAGWAAYRFPDRLQIGTLEGRLWVKSRVSSRVGQGAFAEAFHLPIKAAWFICLPDHAGRIEACLPDASHDLVKKWASRRLDVLGGRGEKRAALLNLSTVIEHFGGGDLYAGLLR